MKSDRNSLTSRFHSPDIVVMAAILLIGVLLYAHTLHAPWYMDDTNNIVNNPSIRHLGDAWKELFSARGVVNLTFALNYAYGANDVLGYHVVNIAIHLIASFVVYLLLKRVFHDRILLAVTGTLIFLVHPLQTQAVTYIVQRSTSLAALFFLLALYFYTRARETPQSQAGQHWRFYFGSLGCGAIAVLVKQNTAVLPVTMFLFDRYFLDNERRLPRARLLVYLAPFVLAPALVAVRTLLIPVLFEGEALTRLGRMPNLSHLEHLSPVNYLFTEFSVIWLYLRLLIFPYGQALDYDYPVLSTIFTWQTMGALLGIIVLLIFAALVRKRLPIISFGVFWFFLALAVESTFIPLDPVFEHRLYLPILGFILIVLALLAKLPNRLSWGVGCVIILILSVLTWQRNDLWNDPVAFYQDNLLHAPRSERTHLELGNALVDREQFVQAQQAYESGLRINSNYTPLLAGLSKAYALTGKYDKAQKLLETAIEENQDKETLYANLGGLYLTLQRYDEAIAVLKKGLAISQDNPSIYLNLGVAYEQTGRFEQALGAFYRAIELDNLDPRLYFSLGVAFSRHGELQKALQAYLMAIKLDPNHSKALYYATLISLQLKNVELAGNLEARLRQVDPLLAGKLAK